MTRRRKFTPTQVRAIRAEHLAFVKGRGYLSLARKYGVGASTIRDVVTYRTYTNG